MDNEPERQSGHASPVVRSSLEADLNRNLCLEDKLRRDDNEEPQELLKRLLSTKSGIFTTSSFAEHQQSAIGCQTSFREIGTGSIGKVFEQPGSVWAFKALLIDRTEKLWNNYLIHLRIQESLDTLGTLSGQVEVPRVAWFANEASKFWDDNLEFFPDDPTFPRRPREILCMERVFPLPEPVRHALIDMFCNPTNSTAAKAHPANKDCLVKLLLGRKRFGSSRPGGSMFFSLRNYKLHIYQVQSLQLDAEEYAKSMAGALAVLHWHTKVDAMDIEFVLGSSPTDNNAVRRALDLRKIESLDPGTSTYEPTTNNSPNFKKRSISLWMIDFDACSTITLNDTGVCQAVKGFLETEPFYPRPFTGDEYVESTWRIFSRRYIETSERITANTAWRHLPNRFIKNVENYFSQHRKGSAQRMSAARMCEQRYGSYGSWHRGRPRPIPSTMFKASTIPESVQKPPGR